MFMSRSLSTSEKHCIARVISVVVRLHPKEATLLKHSRVLIRRRSSMVAEVTQEVKEVKSQKRIEIIRVLQQAILEARWAERVHQDELTQRLTRELPK